MIIPWAVGIQHMAFSALVRSIPMRLCMSYPLQYMFPLTLRMCSVHFWGYPISIKYYWIYLEEYGTALLEDRYGLFLYRCGVFIYNDENSHYNVRIFVLYGCIRYFSFLSAWRMYSWRAYRDGAVRAWSLPSSVYAAVFFEEWDFLAFCNFGGAIWSG